MALRSGVVIMQELTVGKSPADVLKERQDLIVVQRVPRGKGDLEFADAFIVRVAEALDDIRCRQPDSAYLGEDVVRSGLLREDVHDLPESPRIHGVSLSTSAEDVQVVEMLQGL